MNMQISSISQHHSPTLLYHPFSAYLRWRLLVSASHLCVLNTGPGLESKPTCDVTDHAHRKPDFERKRFLPLPSVGEAVVTFIAQSFKVLPYFLCLRHESIYGAVTTVQWYSRNHCSTYAEPRK